MARQSKLASLTMEQLKAELARRQRALPTLLKKRAKLEKLIEAIDAKIADVSGATAPARAVAKRAKKAVAGRKPLAAYVREALTRAPKGMAIREIEKAVLAAGYVTKGKDLYNPIGVVLAKGGFKKVSRGVYVLKGS